MRGFPTWGAGFRDRAEGGFVCLEDISSVEQAASESAMWLQCGGDDYVIIAFIVLPLIQSPTKVLEASHCNELSSVTPLIKVCTKTSTSMQASANLHQPALAC